MTVINFINLLRDHPAIGFLIGLVFFAFMFGIKNVIVYLYSKQMEKEQAEAQRQDEEPNDR